MKAISILVLTGTIFFFSASAAARGWSRSERRAIDQARYSRMRVLTIRSQEDSLSLRRTAEPLDRGEVMSLEFARLVASMIETVNDPSNAGVGIAASQVGISRRLILVQRVDKEGEPFEVYVNPQIVGYGAERAVGPEGCLSIPDMRGNVPRATSIDIEYRDPIDFSLHREHIEGYAAIIFQHETDHLDGVLYIDRAVEVEPEE